MYRDATGVNDTALAQGNDDTDSSYKVALIASDKARFSVWTSANVENNIDSTGTLTSGRWYFIVAWHDTTADTINVQVDNGTFDSASYTSGTRNVATALNIGRHGTTGTYMNGRIQYVGFWKRVLTQQEKTDLYNYGRGNALISY